ncbi:MAG: dephospho-CoA kinase, partial [Campylobacter sp.]|nr:dephospho-CoA kinase [Campylobacter sp.]
TDIEQKRAMADFVIDNSGDLSALEAAVERFLKELKDKI